MTSLFNPVAGIVRKHAARLGVLEPKVTALYNNSAANVPWEVLYQTPQVSIIAPPGTMLYEEILDLAQFGQVLDQQVNNPDAVLTLMDGAVRRATRPTRTPEQDNSEPRPPGTPVGDLSLPLNSLWVGCSPLMDAGDPAEPARPLIDGGFRPLPVGVTGLETGWHDPANRCRYVRLWVMRGSYEFTPQEEVTFASYKVHINWTAPNSVVAEWTYPIPATKGAVMEDRIFDLRDYGADGGVERFCFIMEFRRNGQLIQLAHNQTWEGLTSFDVPTYPVRFSIRGWVDTSTKDYDYDGNNQIVYAQDMEPYGYPVLALTDGVGGARPWGGAVVLRDVSQCTNEGRTLVWMKIWRDTDDTAEGAEPRDGNGLATYTPAPGASPIPIPPGAQDGCTLHVKLLRATRKQEQMYPFQHDSIKPDTWGHADRLDVLEPKVTTLHDNPGPLFYEGGGPELALPDPSLPQWIGRSVRYYRTNGGYEVRFNMDGTAWLTDAIQSWKVANAAARLALAPTAVDVHRVCRQLDDNSAWLCVGYAPAVWRQIDFPAEDFVSNRAGTWKPMRIIFDQAVVIPATPDAVLIDEEVSLASLGLTATTYRNGNFGVIVEKPDGSGGWVATNEVMQGPYNADDGLYHPLPGAPTAADPDGYETVVAIIPSPMALPMAAAMPMTTGISSSVGQDPGRDWIADSGALSGMSSNPQAEDRISRVRLRCRRSSRAYDAGEQATINALGYRVRLVLEVPDLVAWEREVVVPETSDTMIINEPLDLADFGLISDPDRFRFVAEMRRNGKVIRAWLPNEYVVGESFDPPGPTVAVAFRPIFVGTPWWNTQNSSESGQVIRNGWFYNRALAQCSESVRQRLRVMAWTFGPNRTTYYDGTTADTPLDLKTYDPLMDGVLIGRTGFQYEASGQQVVNSNVTFTPMADALHNTYTGLMENTRAVGVADGVRIYFRPGISTLQSVFDAIDRTHDGTGAGPPDMGWLQPACIVWTGTLTTPAYILAQTAEFTVPFTIGPAAPVAVPPGSMSGCTLLIRLLVAPPNRMWEYPFGEAGTGNNDAGLAQMLLRTIQSPVRFPPGGPRSGAVGLWNDRGMLHFGADRVARSSDVTPAYYELVGTGAPQTFAHGLVNPGTGLPEAPARVIVVPVKWQAGSPCEYSTIVDATNINVTMTFGVTYIVMAWRPP